MERVIAKPKPLMANLGNCPVTLERISRIRECVRKQNEDDWGVIGNLELSTMLRVGLLALDRMDKLQIIELCVQMNADEADRWRDLVREQIGAPGA